MSYRLAWTAVTLVLLGLVGCAQAAAVQDPRPTVERFLAARQARNLDATMACFAEQPRLSSNIGMSAVGRDAVRAIMAARITDTYVVDNLRVTGERVTWSQHVRRTAMGSPPTTFDEEATMPCAPCDRRVPSSWAAALGIRGARRSMPVIRDASA